jgi:hypothetical protein
MTSLRRQARVLRASEVQGESDVVRPRGSSRASADTEALPHWRNAREGFDAAGIRIGGALAKRTSMLSR